MRGKRQVGTIGMEEPRNIPAYAGKTISHGHRPRKTEEHPRVCGENADAISFSNSL